MIVCQIGAREHYAIARVLHNAGLLKALITDVWAPPGSLLQYMPGQLGARLRGRYHPDLADANVIHFTRDALAHAARAKVSGKDSHWERTMARNAWFEKGAVRALSSHSLLDGDGGCMQVMAYSYAARDILQYAKAKGACTILGQIDGGEADERLIAEISLARGRTLDDQAPVEYWQSWRDECSTADSIIVNSEWSRQLLASASIDTSHVDVVPIAYEPDANAPIARRVYPLEFNRERPLRVLFLGAAKLRKGIIETIEAARALCNHPVMFNIVGSDPDGYMVENELENIQYFGSKARDLVHRFYAESDIFLFPTHSDGFGMVQIEALAAGLPVIASRNCANLVRHGWNGLILEDVTGRAIAQSIEHILDHPDQLEKMSCAAQSFTLGFAEVARTSLLASIERHQPNGSHL